MVAMFRGDGGGGCSSRVSLDICKIRRASAKYNHLETVNAVHHALVEDVCATQLTRRKHGRGEVGEVLSSSPEPQFFASMREACPHAHRRWLHEAQDDSKKSNRRGGTGVDDSRQNKSEGGPPLFCACLNLFICFGECRDCSSNQVFNSNCTVLFAILLLVTYNSQKLMTNTSLSRIIRGSTRPAAANCKTHHTFSLNVSYHVVTFIICFRNSQICSWQFGLQIDCGQNPFFFAAKLLFTN